VYRAPIRRLASITCHFIIVHDLVLFITQFVESAVGNISRLTSGLRMPSLLLAGYALTMAWLPISASGGITITSIP
jgi:hypothetical protein